MKYVINKRIVLEEAGLTWETSLKKIKDDMNKIADKNTQGSTPLSEHIKQFKTSNKALAERSQEPDIDPADKISEELSK